MVYVKPLLMIALILPVRLVILMIVLETGTVVLKAISVTDMQTVKTKPMDVISPVMIMTVVTVVIMKMIAILT